MRVGLRSSLEGFSIIEVIVTLSILGMVGIVVWSFQKDVFVLNRVIDSQLSAQQEGRKALKMMSEEVRSISPSSIGEYPIAQATATSFTFYVDFDDDGLKEKIRYFLDGAILKKGVVKPSGSPLSYNPANEIISKAVNDIANGVAPIFEYFDKNYDGTTPPLSFPVDVSKVRLLKVTLFIDRDMSRPPPALLITTQVSMRNLKDNL